MPRTLAFTVGFIAQAVLALAIFKLVERDYSSGIHLFASSSGAPKGRAHPPAVLLLMFCSISDFLGHTDASADPRRHAVSRRAIAAHACAMGHDVCAARGVTGTWTAHASYPWSRDIDGLRAA